MRANNFNDAARRAMMRRMEAIAWGVQARFEEKTGLPQRVIDETVNIARTLGVPAQEIERWAVERAEQQAQENERFREIIALLNKAEQANFNTAPVRS